MGHGQLLNFHVSLGYSKTTKRPADCFHFVSGPWHTWFGPFCWTRSAERRLFFFGAPTGMWFNLVDLLWSNVPLACANEGSKCLYHYLRVVTNSELFCKLGCLQVLRLSNVCTYVFLEVGGSHGYWLTSGYVIHFHSFSSNFILVEIEWK